MKHRLLQHLAVHKFVLAWFVEVLRFTRRGPVPNIPHGLKFVLQFFVRLAIRYLCHVVLQIIKVAVGVPFHLSLANCQQRDCEKRSSELYLDA